MGREVAKAREFVEEEARRQVQVGRRQFLDWLEERLGYRRLLRSGLYEAVPVKGAWFYSLGSAVLVLITVQLATGIFLLFEYVPSTREAWESLDYQRRAEPIGAVVRGMHLWSAYILMVVLGLHMVRTFTSASYKRPRELNWISGVVLFLLILAMAITGAFLPWDQAAYWTAVVVTNIPSYTPVIGPWLRTLWRGGDLVGPATLTRTFGIHVWLIPALLFSFIGAHLFLLRRHGEFGSWVNYRGAARSGEETVVPPEEREDEPPYPAYPSDDLWSVPIETEDFYPHQTFRDGVVSTILVLFVFFLAVMVGAPLESPANPADLSYTPVPEWFYLPLDQLLVMLPHRLVPAIVFIPLAGVIALFALPFLDKGDERDPVKRPGIVLSAGLVVAALLILTLLGSGRLFNL